MGLIGTVSGLATDHDVPDTVIWAIATGGFLWQVYRSLRSAIVLRSDRVVVRNLLRDRRAKWSEVEGFEPLTAGAFNRNSYLAVKLRNGHYLRTAGLTARSPESPFARDTLCELERHRPQDMLVS
jgi:hypothetical protein